MRHAIFLSHASDDGRLVDRFLAFLTKGLGVPGKAIYCTRCLGTIPTGRRFVDHIKKHLDRAKVVILLVTPGYLKSRFCLAEMGAAWALDRVCTVVIPPLKALDLDGTPLDGTQSILLDSSDGLTAVGLALKSRGVDTSPTSASPSASELLDLLGELLIHRPMPSSPGVSAIVDFRRCRASLSSEWWDEFYREDQRPQEVIMMGQSMARAFNDKFCQIFCRWCEAGTRMRILFLAPDPTASTQIHQVSQEIAYGGGRSLRLSAKIRDSIDSLTRNVLERIGDIRKRPQVRYATRDLPFSMMALDDRMAVTLYGTQAEADNSPTLVVNGRHTEAYHSFLGEFQRMWQMHSKVYPDVDPLLRYLRRDWDRYVPLRRLDLTPPPPRQAILYPTSRCTAGCSYCMYRDLRGDPKEMDLDVFDRVLGELAGIGVTHIELSGGGEPMEHSKFADIVRLIQEYRKKYPSVQFGLLTNGRHLDDHDPDQMVVTFNEYIRVSRYEGSSDQPERWRGRVRQLLAARRRVAGATCKVSLKYLLSGESVDDFVSLVADDFKDRDWVNVDYFRFSGARTVAPESVMDAEHRVWHILSSIAGLDCEKKVSLSLAPAEYPRNFKCWISPISVVIGADLGVYLCCNYLHDENAKSLGSLQGASFMSLWESPRHRNLRENLTSLNCSRKYYCNCRLAELQTHIDRVLLASGE